MYQKYIIVPFQFLFRALVSSTEEHIKSSSKTDTDQNLPTITTDANDFTEYLANESIEELQKYLKNVFGRDLHILTLRN